MLSQTDNNTDNFVSIIQEFLALVEVRFMDDLRRRTSFVQPFEGFAIAEQPAPTTLAEALAATYINNVRGGLMQKVSATS